MTVYDFPVNTLAGQPGSLADLAGQTLLVVNVASRCGLTPQYEGLERIWEGTSEIQRAIIAGQMVKRGPGALA